MYGMSWEEFWYESMERYEFYWQKYQFDIERRNQELWLQGIYVTEAIATVQDTKHRVKYPDKPHRLTALTDEEKEAENRRKIETLREQLMEIKRRSDQRNRSERN